jgi:hypothetical protein
MYNKYSNTKCKCASGHIHDSKKEAKRCNELTILENAGIIQDLRQQVKFVLIPAQKIGGKVVERECSYYADFVYIEDGKKVVEDTKGMRTDCYVLKRKLMLYVHGIRIKEI